MLTEAAIYGAKDHLLGLKENVIIGKLIPAGSGAPQLAARKERERGRPSRPSPARRSKRATSYNPFLEDGTARAPEDEAAVLARAGETAGADDEASSIRSWPMRGRRERALHFQPAPPGRKRSRSRRPSRPTHGALTSGDAAFNENWGGRPRLTNVFEPVATLRDRGSERGGVRHGLSDGPTGSPPSRDGGQGPRRGSSITPAIRPAVPWGPPPT